MTFFEELKKGFADVSGTIAKKSSEVVEVQKLKIKKASIESDVRKNYELLGRIYFTKMEESGEIDEMVEETFHKIIEANEAIEELDEQIEKVVKVKVCSVCGEKSSKQTKYCPNCGVKFETEEQTKENESADDENEIEVEIIVEAEGEEESAIDVEGEVVEEKIEE